MLEDTPIAYLETLAGARRLGDAAWRARAADAAAGAGFVAVDPATGTWVGTMSAYEPEPGVALLVSVYVAPGWRGGTGAADALLAACVAWARGRGAPVMRLLVHEDNARAVAFYARAGFVPTGRREPYPLDRTRWELEMELDLGTAPGRAPGGTHGPVVGEPGR
ncbi:GNAT family N-acetyltransferase [Vallicoccus soli]|uniref:GNAT family N-acetyltransferase n=2 Tax=Vallicoccus soli TaxID=2339232 RepID=A0A3A3YW89_9ACTN|nr:GNAT family N-acetyltransferase [Vallicoccus soli]